MNPISLIAGIVFWWPLQQKGPALTFARLCTSRHLRDLQWLAFFVIIVMLIAPSNAFHYSVLENDKVLAALMAAAAAVLTWIYQTGSRRIGAVDLFACEISVICRSLAIVDYASLCVEQVRRETEAIIMQPLGEMQREMQSLIHNQLRRVNRRGVESASLLQ